MTREFHKNKIIKRAAAFVLAALMAASAGTAAFAYGPGSSSDTLALPEGMTEERWNQLNDKVIEWDEVEDLITYWNPTYTIYTNQVDESVYDTGIAAYDDTNDLREQLDEVNDTIEDIKKAQSELLKTSGGTESAAYQALEASLTASRSGRDTISSALNSMGSTFRSLKYAVSNASVSLAPARYQLTQVVDGLIISYKTLEVNRELAEKQVELYRTLYSSYQVMLSQDMATQSEVDNYKNQLDTAEATVELLDISMEQVKRNILIQCGYEPGDAEVIIADLPEPDRNYLEGRDIDADRKTAVNACSTVRDADLVTGYSGDVLKYRDAAVASAEASAASAFDGLKAELEKETLLCASSDTSLQIAAIEAASADTKQSLGMLANGEYESLKLQYIASTATAEINKLNLHQAIENYRFALLGLLTVG